jgi:PAS domain S-box-containing protein
MTFQRALRIFPMLLLMAACLGAATSASSAPNSIRVVMDDNYPPFTFRDGSGRLQGILIDQWRLWEQKTGIRAEISAMDWAEALSRMQAGEFDVIDTIFETGPRLKNYYFTRPYQKIAVPIFFDKNISGITNAATLDGFVVAAKKGDAAIEILRQHGVTNPLLFNSYEAIIRAAKEHKVTVFVVDKPPALYFLNKYGILDRFRQSAPLSVGQFHRAVKKGNVELLRIVEDGFGRISADELKQIDTKWYGSSLYDSRSLRYFLMVAGCLALLLLLLFIWNRLLSARVAKRTAELKASLETLRANATFVTTLVNAIPVSIFYKDREGFYLGCNSAFEEFYGITEKEIIGKSVFDIAPKALAEEYHAKDLEILAHPGAQVYESQVKNTQGDIRDVVFHKASFTDSDGQVRGLIGAILDITEQKRMVRSLAESEVRQRTLIQTIPDLIWLKDADGVYLYCNRMFERFFNAREADIIGKSDYDFVDRETADYFREHDRKAMAADKPSSNEEWITFGDDGHHALLNTIKTPMFDLEGKLVGVLGIARDITELRRAETERLNLERRLLHSQKLESLGVLSGGIAHDFNNLLLAVLGNLDLALMKLPADGEVRKNINQAVNAANHAARLTNMMLAYSGKGSFIIKELNLSQLVEENAAMLAAAISKSVRLDLKLDLALPPVMADAGQLQQVVMNLITNASEAIGGETGVISLSTGVREFDQATLNRSRLEEKLSAGSYVWMEVCDDGSGMDRETLHKLFEPFFTTKFTGRGLGMSAVLGIIRAHKGAFLVTSSPGAGTTMLVILPIADRQDSQQTTGSAAPDAALENSPQPDVILIVDDEEMIRAVCVEMMEILGFRTLVAADGEEALRLFEEQSDRIGLVLLDQSMPGMDGVTVFQNLKKTKPDIKVLLASGFSREEISERFTGLGLSGFIQKPFNLNSLSGEVQRLMAVDQ